MQNDEIGMFLGGLLAHLVSRRANEREIEEGWTHDQAVRFREQNLRDSLVDVTTSFAEPLRSKLRADADVLVASLLRLS